MLTIRQAVEREYEEVRSFYHTMIDLMKDMEYKPGWKKGVYPADDYLRDSICSSTLYIGRYDGRIAAAMIVNHESNEGYKQVEWTIVAEANEITVIHALGVLPPYNGKGFAKSMVKEAISIAKQHSQKVLRLDVLGGNLPAERLYTGMGFQYIGTVPMFYEDTGWTDFLLYEYLL